MSKTTEGFWDFGTTTEFPEKTLPWIRKSRFEWVESPYPYNWLHWLFGIWRMDSYMASIKRSGDGTCGLTIGFTNIGVAALLGRRTLLTSANILEPYLNSLDLLRIWCLGRAGLRHTPFRYRTWRIRRIIPKSNNPEHMHGRLGQHIPRHDLAIITSADQIYTSYRWRWRYAEKYKLVGKRDVLPEKFYIWGSGFQTREHIKQNWRIVYGEHNITDIVNCERYLPKWWGKFICIRNKHGYSSVQTGGPLVDRHRKIYAIGCFALNYNEDRILVFTDLRYYVDRLNVLANYTVGDYYEYAYPEFSVSRGIIFDGWANNPIRPHKQLDYYGLFPLG